MVLALVLLSVWNCAGSAGGPGVCCVPAVHECLHKAMETWNSQPATRAELKRLSVKLGLGVSRKAGSLQGRDNDWQLHSGTGVPKPICILARLKMDMVCRQL